MRDALLALQLAVHFEEARLEERATLRLSHTFPHDDVHLAALVLERHESDAARGGGSLAHQHDAGGAYRRAGIGLRELLRTLDRAGSQTLAQQRERMPSQGKSQRGIVGADFLAL